MKKDDANRGGPLLNSRSSVERSTFDAYLSSAGRNESFRPTASPPWGEPGQWAEINARISAALRSGKSGTEGLRRLGKTLSDRIAALIPFMEELAAATCVRCPAPCCLSAKIWFDAKDLLVLHLSKLPPPPAQTIGKMADRCRYIGPRGCRLDRLGRPWVCTWYLCPTQRQRLRSEDVAAYERLQGELKAIGAARKRLLKTFMTEDPV